MKPGSRNFKKGPPKSARPAAAPRGPAPASQSAEPKGPPDRTLREMQYLKNLVVNKTPVRIRLRDNQQVEGVVEYYDAGFIRLTRSGEANLFIYKSDIKYLEEQS
jgi:sRNA-binding regulator protein Hfq